VESIWTELKRRNVVRVALAYGIVSWLMLQLTDVLVSLLTLPEWVGRFVLLILVIGFFLTLFFSWAYEMTPEGVKLERDVDRSQSVTHSTGRKLDFVIIGVLSIALMMFALDKFGAAPDEVPAQIAAEIEEPGEPTTSVERSEENTIAVLPFVNMSSDPEQEYFSDGLSEELLNLLSRIPELRVTSRSSAFFYKGKDFQISDVGQALGVGHVLEGSVRRSGETIRITAQLIEVSSDIHVWSKTWDRKFEDVFAIQDEIAAAVVDALKISMLGEAPRVAETTPEAYALYLQGRSFFALRNADASRQAAALLERALEIDNQYAPAWVLFGQIYSSGSTIGAWEPHEGYPLARSAAIEALRLDEDSAYAHSLLSRIAEIYDYDLETARKEIDLALTLAPGDSNIRANAAQVAIFSGVNVDDHATIRQEAVAADPLNLVLRSILGFSYLYNDRIDEAISVFREIISLNPEVAGARFRLGLALIIKGDYDAALTAINEETRDGFQSAGRAFVYHALGNSERAQTELDELIALGNVWTYEIAMVYAYRGNLDEAFAWLDRAIERRDSSLGTLVNDPFMANLHDDPRFELVVDRIGRTAYWKFRKSQR